MAMQTLKTETFCLKNIELQITKLEPIPMRIGPLKGFFLKTVY